MSRELSFTWSMKPLSYAAYNSSFGGGGGVVVCNDYFFTILVPIKEDKFDGESLGFDFRFFVRQ